MKTRLFLFLILALLLNSCSTTKGTYGSPKAKQELLDDYTFVVNEYSDDPTYGYTEKNPIMVGSAGGNAPLNERRFLNALAGPSGHPVVYKRLGSCCSFKTNNGLFGDIGLLDMYEVTYMYHDSEKTVTLYINMYDSDVLKIPVGFQKRK